uniref:Uncharacterized protein n=1 Tax=Salix viminalis TaxID=40686 RepID=A0A6N2N744_SALVM
MEMQPHILLKKLAWQIKMLRSIEEAPVRKSHQRTLELWIYAILPCMLLLVELVPFDGAERMRFLHFQESSYKKTKRLLALLQGNPRHLLSPSCTIIQRRKIPLLPGKFLQEDKAYKKTKRLLAPLLGNPRLLFKTPSI